jgi:hypothetical protein
MDVEVSLEETLACLLEDYRRPPHAALFALLRFEYLHKWRGLMEVNDSIESSPAHRIHSHACVGRR